MGAGVGLPQAGVGPTNLGALKPPVQVALVQSQGGWDLVLMVAAHWVQSPLSLEKLGRVWVGPVNWLAVKWAESLACWSETWWQAMGAVLMTLPATAQLGS